MADGWKPKKSEIYISMIEKAQQAGFEVIENATKKDVENAWSSKKCSHIVYYNHGTPLGNIRVDIDASRRNYTIMSVSDLFNPKKGSADRVSLACCHYNEATKRKMVTYFNDAKITLDPVVAPASENGEVWRTHYIIALTKFFANLNKNLK